MFNEITVTSANMEFGGISDTGDLSQWQKTVDALEERKPDVVLLQELNGRSPANHQRHLCRTANELNMFPVMGPPTPQSQSGNHVAVLLNKDFSVENFGPPVLVYGGIKQAWCDVEVKIPGFPYPVKFFSVHLPAHSAVWQKMHSEWLATMVAQSGILSVIAGDFNCYTEADNLSAEDLESHSVHLGPPRMILVNGKREANTAVDDTFALANIIDVAPYLAEDLEGTGLQLKGRIDRFYMTDEFTRSACLSNYETFEIGSDHKAISLRIDLGKLGKIAPRGFTP